MGTSRNINDALKTGLKYHVISNNEIHSFSNKKDAVKDLNFGKRFFKRNGFNEKIELKTLQQLT